MSTPSAIAAPFFILPTRAGARSASVIFCDGSQPQTIRDRLGLRLAVSAQHGERARRHTDLELCDGCRPRNRCLGAMRSYSAAVNENSHGRRILSLIFFESGRNVLIFSIFWYFILLIFLSTEKSLGSTGWTFWTVARATQYNHPVSKNARQKCQKCQNLWSASRQSTTPQI